VPTYVQKFQKQEQYEYLKKRTQKELMVDLELNPVLLLLFREIISYWEHFKAEIHS